MMNQISLSPAASDADLVSLSLGGNRDAFGIIVDRYQSLICSIAYSATGCVSRSEDLAQETFFAAWKQLQQLREPGRLRAWLCGIARNLVHNAIRRDVRNPAFGAEPIDEIEEPASAEPAPTQQAISREEESILWRSLERIPDSYREPMVLFYREHQSVERVADAMELSEDVVRQRLSRGRKLLHEEVLAFVEGALERSSPGKTFTIAVLAALPAFALPASAAPVTVVAAIEGGTITKSAGVAGFLKLLAGPFAGIANTFFGHRIAMNLARTPRERADAKRGMWKLLSGIALYVLGSTFFPLAGNRLEQHHVAAIAFGGIGSLVFTAWLVRALLLDASRRVRAEERVRHPEFFAGEVTGRHGCREYRSRRTLFGLPLIHIYLGIPSPSAPPAIGWIAVGDRAVGVLLGVGQLSVGFVSVGIASVGVISIGVISLGVLSVGTLGLGLNAIGTVAIGVHAFSGFCSLGWIIATSGTFAAAHDYALANHAFARHANDPVALNFVREKFSAVNFPMLISIFCGFTVAVTAWYAWLTRKTAETGPSLSAAADSPTDALARPAASPRTLAIDYLRAFIVMLVVVHHAVLAYHPYASPAPASLSTPPMIWRAFPVVDAHRWPGIDLLVGFNDTFFMSLMFFISGLFVWKSLARKGAGAFLRDRCLRLGLPFAVGAAVIAPLAYYPTYLATGATPGLAGFWEQWRSLGVWPAGPAWFLWVLLAFAGVAAALRTLAPRWGDAMGRLVAGARERPFTFFALLVAASAAVYLPMAHMFNPGSWFEFGPFTAQTSRLLLYGLYFVVGVGVGADGIERGLLAPDGTLARRWGLWIALSLVTFLFTVVTFVIYLGVMQRGESAVGLLTVVNFSYVLTCAASSLAFCAVFVRFVRRHRNMLDNLSANAFGIYLLHYPIVSWLQYALRPAELSGAAKGSIVIVAAIGLSWITTVALRQLPGVRRIL